MVANRFTVYLYWRSMKEAAEDTNLDPADDAILRQTLERMVKAKRGTLDLDLSEWRIEVATLGGGRVHAECRVASNGATEVKR